jgi:hypothetical protein
MPTFIARAPLRFLSGDHDTLEPSLEQAKGCRRRPKLLIIDRLIYITGRDKIYQRKDTAQITRKTKLKATVKGNGRGCFFILGQHFVGSTTNFERRAPIVNRVVCLPHYCTGTVNGKMGQKHGKATFIEAALPFINCKVYHFLHPR